MATRSSPQRPRRSPLAAAHRAARRPRRRRQRRPTHRLWPERQRRPSQRDAAAPAKRGEAKYSDVARESGSADLELIEGIERDIVETGVSTTWDEIAELKS